MLHFHVQFFLMQMGFRGNEGRTSLFMYIYASNVLVFPDDLIMSTTV